MCLTCSIERDVYCLTRFGKWSPVYWIYKCGGFDVDKVIIRETEKSQQQSTPNPIPNPNPNPIPNPNPNPETKPDTTIEISAGPSSEKMDRNIIECPQDSPQDSPPIQWKDTIPFTFPITGGQVIKVYDGDTITIASRLPYPASSLYRLSVRLDGIDTPEIKGKTEDEKQAAKNARDAVSNLIMHREVRLENIKSEKYGRILADVYIGTIHLNHWLITNRYAVPYDGGTKHAPESWLKYKTDGGM